MESCLKRVGVFDAKPQGFEGQYEVAACHLEVGGLFLLLQKAENRKWGLPAGKMERGETPEEGMKRELFEETGIHPSSDNCEPCLHKLYVSQADAEFVFHLFHVKEEGMPVVRLSDEHSDYRWVSLEEAKEMDLVGGAHEAIGFFERENRHSSESV